VASRVDREYSGFLALEPAGDQRRAVRVERDAGDRAIDGRPLAAPALAVDAVDLAVEVAVDEQSACTIDRDVFQERAFRKLGD
jgi:hypothetical protein